MDSTELRSASKRLRRDAARLISIVKSRGSKESKDFNDMRAELEGILRSLRRSGGSVTEAMIEADRDYLRFIDHELATLDSEEGLHWLKARFFSGHPKVSNVSDLMFFSELFSENLVPRDPNTWLGDDTARLSLLLGSQSYAGALDVAERLYPDMLHHIQARAPTPTITFHVLPPDNPSRSNEPVLVADLREVNNSTFASSGNNVAAFANELTIRARAVDEEHPPCKVSFIAPRPDSFYDKYNFSKPPVISLSDDDPRIKRYNLQQISDFARSRSEALKQQELEYWRVQFHESREESGKIQLQVLKHLLSDRKQFEGLDYWGAVLKEYNSLIETVGRRELPSLTGKKYFEDGNDWLPENLIYTVEH